MRPGFLSVRMVQGVSAQGDVGEERRFLLSYERELSYEEGRFLLSGEL